MIRLDQNKRFQAQITHNCADYNCIGNYQTNIVIRVWPRVKFVVTQK